MNKVGEAMAKGKRNPAPFPARSEGEHSEPERRAGNGGATEVVAPSPEVVSKPARRRHSQEYKARILRETDACAPGGIGAILRREGLYTSQLHKWRKQRTEGISAQKPGPKTSNSLLAKENAKLERANRRLAEHLRKAKIIIDAQKKLCDALGLEVPPIPEVE